MYIDNDREEIELLIHKALNLVEAVNIEYSDCPRAKQKAIEKLEEALMWLDYKGRSAPTENKRGIK